MLTSRQRAYLKSLANTIPSILQVGKGGINENFIKQVDDALEARELVKFNVLNNSPDDVREVCDEVASRTGAEVVQVIGNRIILYRESTKNPQIILPR